MSYTFTASELVTFTWTPYVPLHVSSRHSSETCSLDTTTYVNGPTYREFVQRTGIGRAPARRSWKGDVKGVVKFSQE